MTIYVFQYFNKNELAENLGGNGSLCIFSKSKLLIVVLFPYRNFGIGARNPGDDMG